MGTFIFDKRKTSPLGSERKRRGGNIFQFTELGDARCVEDSQRQKPELQCYIYPTRHTHCLLRHQQAVETFLSQPESRPEGAWPRAVPDSTLVGACLPHVLRLVVLPVPAWLDCTEYALRGWTVLQPAQLLSKEGWSWEFIPLTGGDDAGLPTPPAKHELRPAAAAATAESHQRGVPAAHPAGKRVPLHLPRQEMCGRRVEEEVKVTSARGNKSKVCSKLLNQNRLLRVKGLVLAYLMKRNI
ncbi:uncharacterized protein LOC120877538 [Oryx dammah]|uniref:uncharacterized protein LOC120877538 n=1 Tax=Oryx dammah TaxID=59534 RepID=UPI001A9B289D|nr:uncharacterized protein LOC120877538 [Oryx dammah]